LYSEDGSGNQYAGSYVDKTDDVIVVCHLVHSLEQHQYQLSLLRFSLHSHQLLHDDVAWKIAKNN